MGENSLIEWTDATWNPITGCSVVSPAMIRVGRAAAGRLLDGVEHNGMPEVRHGT